MGVDGLPILTQIAGSVAHGVAVFAQEKRAGIGAVFDIVGDAGRCIEVHPALDVDDSVKGSVKGQPLVRVDSLTAGDVLTVNHTAVVAGAEIRGHLDLVAADA